MRTTIRLDDHLHGRLKARAARLGLPLGAVIEDALREALSRMEEASAPARPIQLTTVGGRGPRPGVDLDDSAGLLDLLEERGEAD